MRGIRFAVIPGDGIGPEVTDEALRVLRRVAGELPDVSLDWKSFEWGWRYWEETGQVVPEDFLDTLISFDAILLGALGWPDRVADHVTLAPLIRIRQRFDQYACVRPARLFPGVHSVLAGKGPEDIDLVVIRENSEGEYVDVGGRQRKGTSDEVSLQTAVHTRRGVERILRFGFDMALERCGRLTMITKSNAQRYGYVLWDEVLEQVQADYPGVEANKLHVDAAAMDFVRRPEVFDVVVASNLFGDILTDLAGIIAGGLGLAPSTNTNPQRRFPSMFEPVHGSAPDIAGRGIANPTAAVLSVAMMLDWLDLRAAGDAIRRAVAATLAAGHATADLGGSLSTREMGDCLLAALDDP